jgi:hypothetical protein
MFFEAGVEQEGIRLLAPLTSTTQILHAPVGTVLFR